MRVDETGASDPCTPRTPTPHALYVEDAPSERHDYLFAFDDPDAPATADATADAGGASGANRTTTVWRDDVEVDEERSPLVAAVVCAAHLAGVTPMLGHGSDDSSDEEDERERELDSSC